MSQDMAYGDYLQLDKILGAQRPLSGDRNEMLFIIQHQTSELWMKLILHELAGAIEAIRGDTLPPAFKMLARVSRIMEQLVKAWDVLSTMTPPEYSAIRPSLGSSSGFQSYQYRLIEFRLGNKNPAMIDAYRREPQRQAEVAAALQTRSIYDEAIALLARKGFAVPQTVLDRDKTLATQYDADVEAAWLAVYHDPQRYWDLYELAEELVDLEDA
ncbi:MAG TPA: tryptophan 2,3-dioxygenase family protein, partial [Vineibacter sp.]|nr:tryptophan 2,3-dioxygenase family protein [Vineibacter sp.]